jgi:hypothetical protein
VIDQKDLEREIRSTAVDFSFGELLNLHMSNEIVIQPEYQRLFRWSYEQRSRLIESIILGLPIPPIFLIENHDGVLELIDGLQRTSSVLQFLSHEAIGQPELTLTGCDILISLNGLTINDLPTSLKMKIKRSPIRATIINKSGDPYVKYEMFKRLNTGGSLLSAQEIRNCSSRMIDGGAELYEAIQDMSKYPAFVTSIEKLPDLSIEKRANEELVLRFFAVTKYRNLFKKSIEEWLDNLMEKILFKDVDFDLKENVTNFEKVFSLIEEKLGNEAFTRFNENGNATGRLAPAYFEAVVTAFYEHADTISQLDKKTVKERLINAFDSPEFRDSTGPGANTIEKLSKRIESVQKYLIGHVHT